MIPNLHTPSDLVADLIADLASAAEQAAHDDAHAGELEVELARAGFAELRNDTSTPPAKLAAKLVESEQLIGIAERRAKAAADIARRATHATKGAETVAVCSDEGTRRRLELITTRPDRYAAVQAALVPLLAAVGDLQHRDRLVVSSLRTELAAGGMHLGQVAVDPADGVVTQIANAVDLLGTQPVDVIQDIARTICKQGHYDTLGNWPPTAAQLTDRDRQRIAGAVPVSISRGYFDAEA